MGNVLLVAKGQNARDQPEMMPGRERAEKEMSEPLRETRDRFRSVGIGKSLYLAPNIPWPARKNQMKLKWGIDDITS